MKKFKHIIFDVDGVLINSMPIWADSANLYLKEKFDIDAPEELDKKCETMSLLESGAYVKECYPEIPLSVEELANGVAEFIRDRYWKVEEMPGMIKTIRTLYEKGYQLHLATASEEENVKGALSNLGVYTYFQNLFTCTQIGYSKSYIQFFEEVSKRIGVPCEELVMVEDSLHSISTAKKAGLTVFAVYEDFSKDKVEVIKNTCDQYFNQLDEILDVL